VGFGTRYKTAVGALVFFGAVGLTPARREVPAPSVEVAPLPNDLADTGLYSDWASRAIARDVRPFTPQYPLWSDGATKRRWIRLPSGARIDASSADAWQFPVGTKLWKELAFGGPVETRFMERTSAGWRFATYRWSDDGRSAVLAPPRGMNATAEVASGVHHRIPSEGDCRVCHENGRTPVLGFSALQLSSDRDPNAVHRETPAPDALDLRGLVEGGWLRGWSGATSPRIGARTPVERAALGYLHANCGGCHRPEGGLSSLEMVLASSTSGGSDPTSVPAIFTTLDRASRIAPERPRIASGAPDRSVLLERMRSRAPTTQMPPLGTQVVDEDAVRLVTAWIDELPKR
jgi:hypothetical protein